MKLFFLGIFIFSIQTVSAVAPCRVKIGTEIITIPAGETQYRVENFANRKSVCHRMSCSASGTYSGAHTFLPEGGCNPGAFSGKYNFNQATGTKVQTP